MEVDKPDLICISESHLDNDIKDSSIELPGYSILRNDRNRHGGGVITYIQHCYNASEVKKLSSKAPSEYIWIKFTLNKRSIYICSAYYSPSVEFQGHIYSELTSNIAHINSLKKSSVILVTGDFNTHNHSWMGSCDGNGKPKDNSSGTSCETFCALNSLTQMVNFPTHGLNKSHMYSRLDLVMSNKTEVFRNVYAGPPLGLSKHVTICSNLNLGAKPPPPPAIERKNFKKADFDGMKEYLATCDWTCPRSDSADIHLQSLVSKFHYNINQAIIKFVPTKLSGGKRKKPWFTPDCLKSMKKTKTLFKIWRKSKSETARANYLSANSTHKKNLRHAQNNHTIRISAEIAAAKNSKDWWSLVNNVLEKNYKPQIPGLELNGQDFTTDLEKAQVLNKFNRPTWTRGQSNSSLLLLLSQHSQS